MLLIIDTDTGSKVFVRKLAPSAAAAVARRDFTLRDVPTKLASHLLRTGLAADHTGHIVLADKAFVSLRKEGFFSVPQDVMVELLLGCNFRCQYCCVESDTIGSGFDAPAMSSSDADRVVTQLIDLRPANVMLTGGEPLLWHARHGGLFELAARLRRAHIGCTLLTNGALLQKHRDEVIGAGFTRVAVTLDAVDEEVASRVARVRVRPMEIVANIAHLVNHGVFTTVNAVVLRANRESIRDLALQLRDAGVTALQLLRARRIGTMLRNAAAECLTQAEWRELRSALVAAHVPGVTIGEDAAHVAPAHRSQAFESCKAGRSYMLVNWNGDVVPCIGYKRTRVGSIHERSLKAIWNDAQAWGPYRASPTRCPLTDRWGSIMIKLERPHAAAPA